MNIFSEVQTSKPGSNTFDLSHDKKMSMVMGTLTPTSVIECIPGDNIRMSTAQMVRLAPMIAPVMHQVNVFHHAFFVPNRIIWNNWEDFITGGEDGDNTSVFPTVVFNAGSVVPGCLADYMGIPQTDVAQRTSAIPFFGFNKIFNEYYRDQNLQNKLPSSAIDGTNTDLRDDLVLEPPRRAWEHDYFTSALPFTQKGAEATIPLGSANGMNFIDPTDEFQAGPGGVNVVISRDGPPNNFKAFQEMQLNGGGTGPVEVSLQSTSINDLRNAFRLQEWLEKNARGGTRYIESIESHFGVKSDDARLQRPEYLGGSKSPITISEVLQTSGNDAEPTPQGNMAGHGISVGSQNGFTVNVKEHGYIITIMSIMPKPAYFQGIPKHYIKFDKFDYYWPSFAHLGEQPIQNREIYANTSTPEDTFGYTPRYAEYKYQSSTVHGEFRTTLDFWHMARKFATAPALNSDFIECDPTSRIFAVTGEETIYAHVFHKIKARRLMPYFGTPKGV